MYMTGDEKNAKKCSIIKGQGEYKSEELTKSHRLWYNEKHIKCLKYGISQPRGERHEKRVFGY